MKDNKSSNNNNNNNNKCASNYNICVNDGMCTPTKINSPSVYIFSILIKTHVYKHDLYPLHVERKEEEKEAKDKKWRRKKNKRVARVIWMHL